MKKAVKRKAYESDSDSSIEYTTNRGHKLKKRARFVREGKLGPPTGPAVYKEVVEHAGYQRAIISRNPPLIDEDGYDIDSADDEEQVQEAIASAAEVDPYSSIHLESLLAPLTAVTDLPHHPTMSRPFTSKSLTNLAVQGRNLMYKENAALWKVRPLLTRLTGDHTWVNCEKMLGPSDFDYFSDDFTARLLHQGTNGSTEDEIERIVTPKANGGSETINGSNGDKPSTSDVDHDQETEAAQDVSMADATVPEIDPVETNKSKDESSSIDGDKTAQDADADKEDVPKPKDEPNGEASKEKKDETVKEAEKDIEKGGGDVEMTDGVTVDEAPTEPPKSTSDPNDAHSRAMSATPAASDESFIHPIFLAPASAHPDRDNGLPDQEAEDVRRLLQLYIQKQEEVCRGTKKLYEGLLKADRLRKTVLSWSKAEAHIGPGRDMSDGEDWYDKEEWGLTDDLKKGQDEEEEDTTQTQKKTRNRK